MNTDKAKQLEYLHEFSSIKAHTDSLLIFSDNNLFKGTFISLINDKYLIYSNQDGDCGYCYMKLDLFDSLLNSNSIIDSTSSLIILNSYDSISLLYHLRNKSYSFPIVININHSLPFLDDSKETGSFNIINSLTGEILADDFINQKTLEIQENKLFNIYLPKR